jgi:hypothetical protein
VRSLVLSKSSCSTTKLSGLVASMPQWFRWLWADRDSVFVKDLSSSESSEQTVHPEFERQEGFYCLFLRQTIKYHWWKRRGHRCIMAVFRVALLRVPAKLPFLPITAESRSMQAIL